MNAENSKEHKAARRLIFIILLSWAAIPIMAGFFIYFALINANLKRANTLFGEKFMQMSGELQKCRDSHTASDIAEANALEFVEWQFVVREQSLRLARRLEEEISKQKETKKNYPLLNAMHYNLGISYINAMDFASAIAEFQKALKYKSDDKWSFYNLGLLYSTYSQDIRKAIENYKKFLSLEPRDELAETVRQRIESLTNGKAR